MGIINDVDSEGEDAKDSKSIRSEFFGGCGEDDCEEQEDIEGDPTVRRRALFKMTLDECRAVLRRDRELERARAPGRHKEADMQMQRYMATFGHVLTMPAAQIPTQRRSHLSASTPLRAAQDYQRAVAKEMRQ